MMVWSPKIDYGPWPRSMVFGTITSSTWALGPSGMLAWLKSLQGGLCEDRSLAAVVAVAASDRLSAVGFSICSTTPSNIYCLMVGLELVGHVFKNAGLGVACMWEPDKESPGSASPNDSIPIKLRTPNEARGF